MGDIRLVSGSRSDHFRVCLSLNLRFRPIPGLRRPLASKEPGNQPPRAATVGVVLATELNPDHRGGG
jgi:hypothetical protein